MNYKNNIVLILTLQRDLLTKDWKLKEEEETKGEEVSLWIWTCKKSKILS